MPRHILLTGARGAGKSVLLRRLLAAADVPVYGFITKREAADASGFHPIYIHPAGMPEQERTHTEENLAGTCDRRVHTVRPEAFNAIGAGCLRAARPGGVLVMDELGFLEAGAETEAFQQAGFAALDGDIPVLAAVKDREDIPFLGAVRAHPNAALYTVTPQNRDALYALLAPRVLAWRVCGGA